VHRVQALLGAVEAQVRVGRRIRAGQLSLGTPCAGWSVRQVMNHSIGITLKFAEFASGVTNRPTAPQGDLVGPDHVRALSSCATTAKRAWKSVDPTRSCDLSFGSFSADLAAGINLFDVLAHTWDIATATSVEIDCVDVLWSAGLDAARTVIGTSRDPAHYAPEMPVGPNAGPREQFLRFLGRVA